MNALFAQALAACACLSGAAMAAPLSLPAGAELTAEEAEANGSFALPTGAWQESGAQLLPTEGQLRRSAWRIAGSSASTLDLIAPLRSQLEAAGFTILFACETDACGGFDFRFASGTMNAPAMHVDLGDFRFLSARRGTGQEAEYLGVMVSRSATEGFLQLTEIRPAAANQSEAGGTGGTGPITTAPTPTIPGSFAERLEGTGYLVLDDLAFETGSSELGKGPFDSLGALAAYLRANPERTVALVGHTDAEGSLEGNVALSKKRAASVAARLTQAHGVNPEQISAEGMGFLSPRASNLTDDGRTQNRRVEVVLTSTQ
ncbi:OmpA family protein [Pseudoruegeria sp. SHC-113]|uniref:OmpA family protein n=1 Tax=Pseudoruegeria sp. SHC-113 TaxID=2855439 RepID=UPI0021BA828D|nr:OmpA family protein [Pseudoruegeria sp. SHC-113]MCT8159095.1 OmpA family protein [Pseudoruegeria sp. SHC-113]